MNERLKELYRQAHGTRHYDGDPALDGNPPTVYWQGEASAQRFANLIIRECLDCIAKVHKTEYTKEFNEGYTLGVERCFYKIEEHFFGVEE